MAQNPLLTLGISSWDKVPTKEIQQQAIQALEHGQVVYLDQLPFALDVAETKLLTPALCDGKSKNVSYELRTNQLSGTRCGGETRALLQQFMQRYAVYSTQLIHNLFPEYKKYLKQARTSYRPVEVAGRTAPSYRKDDTLLHVDAFPASPVQGERILRVFTNINPHGKPRVWRTGEALDKVINKFVPQVSPPFPGSAWLLKLFKITRGKRTKYDHYMLNIHHRMKADQHYQKNCTQYEIHLAPGATWIVYTDQVSHAAMSGQYVLEQTFYLPASAMHFKNTAPVKVLEESLKIACI